MKTVLRSLLCIVLGIVMCVGITSCSPKGSAMIDVDYISQLEKYPTGCESVSTVMALNYVGIDVTVDEFIDYYLPLGSRPTEGDDGQKVGSDPNKFFIGDPYDESGYGCYSPVIAKAVEDVLDSGYDGYKVKELKNKSLGSLCINYLDKDIPVIFWATMGMAEAKSGTKWIIEDTGEEFVWTKPMHCLLLVGYDDEYYYFNDPQVGKQCKYEKDDVEKAYEAMGKQAVVVMEK